MRIAVVGHVEWIEFVRVERAPRPGEIVHALEVWEEPGGGGAVAAVELARLTGSAALYTILGGDELGRRARTELEALGVTVHATASPEQQRRAVVFVDGGGERTITVLGDKLVPRGGDRKLPWHELKRADAVYFVSGDVEALEAARRGPLLVASARELSTLQRGALPLEALVGSGEDEG
ncbi:MAG: ribokinase, partial [Actinobacteria bacterium]|nr:ribokinase [Actinomycetota bacterium]